MRAVVYPEGLPLGMGADADGRAVGGGAVSAGSGVVVGVLSSGLGDADVLGSTLWVGSEDGSELAAGVFFFAVLSGSVFTGSAPPSRLLTCVTVVPSPPDSAWPEINSNPVSTAAAMPNAST